MARRGKFSDARYEEIKKEVLFMFEETETDTYPIDCFEIARRLHYVLRPYSALGWDAYLEALDESDEGYSKVETDPVTGMNYYVIYYNDMGHGMRNIRWTIFHEIGHIYLGHQFFRQVRHVSPAFASRHQVFLSAGRLRQVRCVGRVLRLCLRVFPELALPRTP